MSLIMIGLHRNFLIAASDQRALADGVIIHESYRKIFKISKTLILCITGTLEDSYELLKDYLEYTTDITLGVRQPLNVPTAFENACPFLHDRFTAMKATGENGRNRTMRCMVCGWNGKEFTFCTFSMMHGRKASYFVKPPLDRPDAIYPSFAGSDYLDQHMASFRKLIGDTSPTIDSVKRAFASLLNNGMVFDRAINNKPLFESILLSDV